MKYLLKKKWCVIKILFKNVVIKIFLEKLFIRRNIYYTILIKLMLIISYRDYISYWII